MLSKPEHKRNGTRSGSGSGGPPERKIFKDPRNGGTPERKFSEGPRNGGTPERISKNGTGTRNAFFPPERVPKHPCLKYAYLKLYYAYLFWKSEPKYAYKCYAYKKNMCRRSTNNRPTSTYKRYKRYTWLKPEKFWINKEMCWHGVCFLALPLIKSVCVCVCATFIGKHVSLF